MRLFNVGCPTIALYDDGALTTKKSAMVVAVLGAFLAKIDKVMTPIGYTTSPVKPSSGMGEECNLSRLIPILTKAS